MKINTKINLYFAVAFLVTSLLSFFAISQQVIKILDNQAYKQIESVNKIKSEHISTFLNSEREVIQALASDYNMTRKEIEEAKKNVSQINELYLIGLDGKVLLSSDQTQEGSDKTSESYFVEGQKRTYVSDFHFSDIFNKNTYSVSAPVIDGSTNKLKGVIVARMEPDNLYSIVESKISLGDSGESFLVNKDRYFISPSRYLGSTVVLNKKVQTQNVDECFSNDNTEHIAKKYFDYRNAPIIGSHAYLNDVNWCLISKIDYSEILDQNYQIVIIATISIFASLALFLVVGYFLSKKIVNPINNLINGARNIIGGNYTIKLNSKSKDEIGELSRTFDQMTDVVKKTNEDIEIRVLEQTRELDDQKTAILNILEDTENSAEELEKFKLAVENVSDQVVITDSEGIVLYGNKAIKRITGYEPEESIGKKAGKLWSTPMGKEYYENMWKTIKTDKKVFISEITNVRKGGEKYQAMINISPILNNNNEIIFFVGIERDITKEKEIDNAKTEFISLASHQLRTPLSTINWYVEMLLSEDAGKINKEQRKFLEEAYAGSQRMVSLVNALLNVSRIESNSYMIEPVPTDVSKLLDSVIFDLKPKIEAKKLIINLSKDNIPTISLDPNLTNIIFQNLITNAVKYTKIGGKVDIGLNIKKDTNKLVISVKDDGLGIPETQKDKIFTKLFRADNVKKTDTEGTGLGLYLIKGLIERSKGKIWFESTENIGSTFYVTLPLAGMVAKEGTKQLS